MLLAFDTSGPIGSVAVAHRHEVLARIRLTRQAGHASALVPAIQATLEEAGVDREEISAIVVGEGPGSFTGVRVAGATAKGLVQALRVPLWAVSSLAGAALSASGDADGEGAAPRYALFDARGTRVYGGCWRVRDGRIEEVIAPHGGELEDVFVDALPADTIFVGDGAEQHRTFIEGRGHVVHEVRDSTSVADGLVRYLAGAADVVPVPDASVWEPTYVRVSGAERLWRK